MTDILKKSAAEFAGTFIMVFAGFSAIIISDQIDFTNNCLVAVVFGTAVMLMIFLFGNISGAHFNPAVTFGFAVARRLSFTYLIPYALVQTAAVYIASLLLSFMYNHKHHLLTVVYPGDDVSAFVSEVVCTFILMTVILHESKGAKEKGRRAGAVIGLTVTLLILCSTAAFNPARSVGPAIISGWYFSLRISLFAPFVGAALAGFVYPQVDSRLERSRMK